MHMGQKFVTLPETRAQRFSSHSPFPIDSRPQDRTYSPLTDDPITVGAAAGLRFIFSL